MTRVLHLIASADRRGAEVFGTELAARLDARGLQDDVLALAPARAGSTGLDVEVLAGGPYRSISALRRRVRAAHVVVGHGSTGLPAGALGSLGTRTRFVYRSIGDPSAWGAASAVGRAKVTVGLAGAAAVVALWDEASEVIGRAYRVPARRRTVIPNAADPDRFAPASDADRAAARTALDLGDGPVLAVIGALGPEKRADRAVAALAELPDATLLVVGDGPQADVVDAAAAPYGTRVRRLAARDDLGPIYAATDVVVSTSSTEGQSGVLIEARLSGVAVVATDVGGSASVVDAEAGAVVGAGADPAELAAAIRRVLAVGPGVREAGRDRAAARFAIEPVTDAWAALLDAVRHGGPLPSGIPRA